MAPAGDRWILTVQWMSDAVQHIFLPDFVLEAVWKNNFNANIKWIYISYFSESSDSREPCVVLKHYRVKAGPTFQGQSQ